MSRGPQGVRYAEMEREFDQARVQIVLDIDGGGRQDVATGIPFFDHLLRQMGHFGYLNLGVKAEGDFLVDDLHTICAVGTTLGRCYREALRLSEKVVRYADSKIANEDALVAVTLDLQGRGSVVSDFSVQRTEIGEASSENLLEFFPCFCIAAGVTVHIQQLRGENSHHLFEALFIAFGVGLYEASRIEESRNTAVGKGKVV